jgi:hypothetical protein
MCPADVHICQKHLIGRVLPLPVDYWRSMVGPLEPAMLDELSDSIEVLIVASFCDIDSEIRKLAGNGWVPT